MNTLEVIKEIGWISDLRKQFIKRCKYKKIFSVGFFVVSILFLVQIVRFGILSALNLATDFDVIGIILFIIYITMLLGMVYFEPTQVFKKINSFNYEILTILDLIRNIHSSGSNIKNKKFILYELQWALYRYFCKLRLHMDSQFIFRTNKDLDNRVMDMLVELVSHGKFIQVLESIHKDDIDNLISLLIEQYDITIEKDDVIYSENLSRIESKLDFLISIEIPNEKKKSLFKKGIDFALQRINEVKERITTSYTIFFTLAAIISFGFLKLPTTNPIITDIISYLSYFAMIVSIASPFFKGVKKSKTSNKLKTIVDEEEKN